MTDGPDWADTFAAIKRPPGQGGGQNSRLGMDQVAQWQEFQQQRTGADVAVAVGAVDTGDNFDGWGAVAEWAQDVTDGIADGASNFGNLVEGLFEALTGNSGAQSYVDPVQQLQYLADTVSGHAQALAELQASNNGEGNGGLSFTDNFAETVTGGPPSGWTARSTNGITTYVDTHEGRAQWYNSGNANPVLMWQRTDPATAKTLTQYQKIVATITTPVAGSPAHNRVYGRMSPDGTHYVVGYVSGSTVYLAYATGGAETVFDSGPMPVGVTLSNGRQLTLECGTNEGPNEYSLTISGINAVSHIDMAHAATDATNYAARGLSEQPLGWAVGWRPAFDGFGQWQRPAAYSAASISDNVPVDVQGHGFRVYRETTTGSGSLSIGDSLTPFYDTIDYISPGSAWSSSGYTIPKSGMWMFSHRVWKDSTTTWTAATFALKVNGVTRAAGASWVTNNVAQDTFVYYCKKGDVVSVYLGNKSGSAAVSMNGTSSGLDSFFSGALMSS